MELKQKITEIYYNCRKTYGSPRIHQKLLREGYPIGRKRVARLMQEMGIQALAKRKYKATTDSKHSKPVAQNHLNRDFTPEGPNTSWVADITYIYTHIFCLRVERMVDSYRKVSINNLELKVPGAPLHDLSACVHAQAERIQLRIVPDRESGLSEVRFWHEDEFLGSQKVKNSELNLVQF